VTLGNYEKDARRPSTAPHTETHLHYNKGATDVEKGGAGDDSASSNGGLGGDGVGGGGEP
jgi:hypothetical protein